MILPGVGAFGDAMARLTAAGFTSAIPGFVARGGLLLGICLGMQVLLSEGEEGGIMPGLGLIPGRVRQLEAPGLKVPHVGWNNVTLRSRNPLFAGLRQDEHFYFVHSYAAFPEHDEDRLGVTSHGEPFASVVARRNLFGTQFHPEKSGAAGLTLLHNFLALSGGTDEC